MKQKLLDEQFALLQGTITEAENIIQDAVTKLDDPLHIRCTSSPGQNTTVSLEEYFGNFLVDHNHLCLWKRLEQSRVFF